VPSLDKVILSYILKCLKHMFNNLMQRGFSLDIITVALELVKEIITIMERDDSLLLTTMTAVNSNFSTKLKAFETELHILL